MNLKWKPTFLFCEGKWSAEENGISFLEENRTAKIFNSRLLYPLTYLFTLNSIVHRFSLRIVLIMHCFKIVQLKLNTVYNDRKCQSERLETNSQFLEFNLRFYKKSFNLYSL